ncbi:hypothetical protein [Dyadobacter sp. CY323]|uniref:hypothetical protein n=1 Tax=Dyadobacter sp. CY323 TaxID=2907302 RepID=UPI001F1E38C0|nr:hypothetical protein [Dyadobacter sp. CY323]MCE6992501.1 hypothetical protein [Dyadobacter sp. CY323]
MIKRKHFVNLTFSLLAPLLWIPCLAQKKYEREYSIKPNAVPENAISFVSSVFKKAKIHWYREEGLTGKSIEAKLKSSGKRYSIEFDESGNIQDVEVLSRVDQMNSAGRAKLKENLGKKFSGYKIVKTQLHWNGSEKALKESLLKDKAVAGIVVRYELIVKGSQGKKEHYFEVLSENDGEVVSLKEIVQRNTDNLIY